MWHLGSFMIRVHVGNIEEKQGGGKRRFCLSVKKCLMNEKSACKNKFCGYALRRYQDGT